MNSGSPLRSLARWAPEGGLARKLLTVSAGVLLGHLVTLAVMPLLSRLYGPEAFAALGVFMAVVGLVGGVASLCYERAIPVVGPEAEARSLLVVALAAVAGVALVALAVVAGLKAVRPAILTSLGVAAWLIPLGILALGSHQTLVAWGLRQQRYGAIARAKTAQAAGTALAQTAAGLAGLAGAAGAGGLGLAAGDALGRFLGFSTLLAAGGAQRDLLAAPVRWRVHLGTALVHRRYPLFGVGSGLLNNLALNGPTLLVAACLDPRRTGLFVFALRIVSIPSALVGQAAAQVYLGEMAALVREYPDQFRPRFRATARKLALASFPLAALMAALAPLLTAPLFGQPWREAGLLMAILAPSLWLGLIGTPVSSSLILLGRQDLQLAWDAGRCLLMGGVLGEAALAGRSLLWLAGAYSLVMVGCYLALLGLIDWEGGRAC